MRNATVGENPNNFGFLRLWFASAVIISHAPEQIDGTRRHEPLLGLFHTMTLGDLAVDCFFLVSGFLIAQSALTGRSYSQYLSNRVRRIVPGYLVSYGLCVFALAPLLGINPLEHLGKIIGKAAFLAPPPDMPGTPPGWPQGTLNRTMWTIAYEFRCYILVLALAGLDLLQRRRAMLLITAATLAASVTAFWIDPNGDLDRGGEKVWWTVVGTLGQSLRLFSTFLVGSCFYLYWPSIKDRVTAPVALVSALVLAAALFVAPLANAAVAVFGGAALFWLALKADFGPLQRINDRWDISYGVYLYGGPIAVTILYLHPHLSAWVLVPVTLLVAMLLGAISWYLVEKPMQRARASATASVPISQAA